jgi:hypothetical protein
MIFIGEPWPMKSTGIFMVIDRPLSFFASYILYAKIIARSGIDSARSAWYGIGRITVVVSEQIPYAAYH